MTETQKFTAEDLYQLRRNLYAQGAQLAALADQMDKRSIDSLEIGSKKSFDEGLRRIRMFVSATFNALNAVPPRIEHDPLLLVAEEEARYEAAENVEKKHGATPKKKPEAPTRKKETG